MHGLTRGATTLIGVAVAGFLIWLGADALPSDSNETAFGEFWWAVALIAAAGLTMALSQLLGGWTKWGWPRVSGRVLLLGFVPTLIVAGWLVTAGEPGDHWLGQHVRSWSDDIGVEGFVGDMFKVWPALAFGIGLVFGLTFDTTGPRTEAVRWRKRRKVAAPGARPEGEPGDGRPSDGGRQVRSRDEGTPAAPEPEAPPRSGVPAGKK